ncbi:protocadherin alpha-C2-like isoform X4 [Acipenser ruthenus]|uniref:protocadherin alpha-C2-like isoform X4 n=1 Tax=Acipenser ruthenus TaxID=7906 RepID=UPI002740FD98|nr:protocadherin alpha-C2-like isoform X4 [Acipenser ruthenus]
MEERDRGSSLRFTRILLHFAFLCFWNKASAQIRYSIPEELDYGAFVGSVAEDLGLDIKRLSDRRFRIVSGSKQQLLQVNQNNGILSVHENIDREQLCDRNKKCVIHLKLLIENPLEMHYVEIEITDINDNAPSFPVNHTTLDIAESSQQGARFPLESAHDSDAGIHSLRSYQLSQNEHFEVDIQDRSEYSKIPVLILRKNLDRERDPVHHLLLTAVDGGTPPRSGTLWITINVLDTNDNAPVFDQEMYSASLQENALKGTVVIRLNATDRDEGLNGEIMYMFGKSNSDRVQELFSLDSSTGDITVKGLLDFEENELYEIDIQATDRAPSPFSGHCSVIVKITDVNDNTPEIEVTSVSNIVSENIKPGSVIALISVTDLDSGINSKVTCTVSENIAFELKPSFQKNTYSLVTTSHLDREIASQYNITVTAKDFGEPPLSSHKIIAVSVSDINDNRPRFSQDYYTLYLAENNTPGASIFSVSAFDPDQDENARVKYFIWDSQVQGTPISSFISINSDSGDIYAIRSFDFEQLQHFTFQVEAKDCGEPSLSSSVAVNVFILDQNDNAPVILSPVPKNGTVAAVETIPRNVERGYLITKVRAYDADIGYNAWLSFSLQQASDPNVFSVGLYTGEIRTLRQFTEIDSNEHKLVIIVKDHGTYTLSTTVTIHITAAENSDELVFSDLKSSTKTPEGDYNLTFYLIIILGSISALFLISIITLVVIQCQRPRGQADGQYCCNPSYAEVSGNGSLYHTYQYRMSLNGNVAHKDFVLVQPETNAGVAVGPGSKGNTLVIADVGIKAPGEPRQPNTDWRYSASLRAGMQSSVLMEESAVLQGAPVVHVQNWPTVSSATPEPDAGEVSPPVGAGINSNSWTFKYGPGNHHQQQQQQQQLLKPGEVPENFIIPGSPAIISIRQDQAGAVDGKGDFITFGKKEETKKKKKKKKGKADKKEKGGGNNDNSDH